MSNRFDCQSSTAAAYLARPAERLVLEGYRRWISGAASGSLEPWREAAALYRGILGDRGSDAAVHALSEFVATLGRCATCPLKIFECGSRHICRDEVLVLGLISGIQNRDEAAVETCLTELTCPTRCDEVALAAGSFALLLHGLDKMLLPIPVHVVRDILNRSRAPWGGASRTTTLH